MNYKVIKVCTRKSENMKLYNVGDLIYLEIEQAVELLKDGFIEVIEAPIKTAAEKMTDFKTKTTKKAK